MNRINSFGIVWAPLSERVGTIEVENLLVQCLKVDHKHIYTLGAASMLHKSSDNVSVSTPLLRRSLLSLTFHLSHIAAGRLTIFLQSFFGFLSLVSNLLRYKPRFVSVAVCLFPLPIISLKFLLFNLLRLRFFRCYCFIQGTPVFDVSQTNRHSSFWRSVECLLRKFLYRYVYPHSDGLVVSSHTLARELISRFKYSNQFVHVIPNGIVCSKSININRYSFSKADPVNFLFIGRLAHQKNILGLLKAYEKYYSSLEYDSHLHIIGDGEQKKDFTKLTTGRSNVSYYGYLDNPWFIDLPNTIVLVPSYWEEPGHVPLEATSRGFLTLISDGCTCTDFIDSSVKDLFTFKANDLDQLFLQKLTLSNLKILLYNYPRFGEFVKYFTRESFMESVIHLFAHT